jgi:hypothetical protein
MPRSGLSQARVIEAKQEVMPTDLIRAILGSEARTSCLNPKLASDDKVRFGVPTGSPKAAGNSTMGMPANTSGDEPSKEQK